MGFRAVDHCVNIVSFEKNRRYGMACAWMMQVDYDKIVFLIGSQSDTGKNISIKDHIGVSSLSKDQKNIAIQFGNGHSEENDKTKGIPMKKMNTALVVEGACRMMEVEVLAIYHLEGIEEDYLIYGKILSSEEHGDSFLHMSDMDE